ncbi:hypothetical protein [Roseiterribacter gracilis]|uniref:Uncharacterized protein n=1 Tax=Roseiterribacter gracilis TaxID=2812848 RepID=A0A8S8X9T9_9PROT|nr:hypothetical protein TMPK1_24600 [Rhodospirillales bacterium TMPK1]
MFEPGPHLLRSATRAGILFALAAAGTFELAHVLGKGPLQTETISAQFLLLALLVAPLVQAALVAGLVIAAAAMGAGWLAPLATFGLAFAIYAQHDVAFVAAAVCAGLTAIQFRVWAARTRKPVAAFAAVAWTTFIANATLIELADLVRRVI